MGNNRHPLTADEANAAKIACKRGHIGLWEKDKRVNRNTSRRCGQCFRDKARIHFYGLTEDAYDQLLVDFPVCAICGKSPEETGLGSLEIDHNHDTGEVRGLLCRRCNIFLGYFERASHLIPRMKEYLNI